MYDILEHKNFNKIGECKLDNITSSIEKLKNKSVKYFEWLDRENVKFYFTDSTTIELLFRKA